MFSTTDIENLTLATKKLLKEQANLSASHLEELKKVLRFHEHQYYVLDQPSINDFEYDSLYTALLKIEKTSPELITPDSPSQRVGSSLTGNFKTVNHLVPMLSLENSYNANDLIDWDRKAKEAAGLETITYCVEPKFDGASISLIYENNLLSRAATRGDGVQGDEITTNIKQIKSIPLYANFSKYKVQQIEIRGEVLLSKKNFEAYNNNLLQQNLPPLANPRNAASGSLRMKDPNEVAKRNLEAFLYHVAFVTNTNNEEGHATDSHSNDLQMLWDLGFKSPTKEKKVIQGIEGVIAYVNEYEAKRDNLPYEIDGMVIKVDSLSLQEKLGNTSHHPRWAIAYKFKARQAIGKLLSIEYQVGRTGAVTPVAKTAPIAIGGVMVSSISLHNQEFIKEKDIRLGDSIVVERAGDVIPYVVQSLADKRTGEETEIVYPTHCPVCNSALVKPESEAVWRCNNYNCAAQVVERIIHFASKDCMDIRGLGEQQIRKFFDLGLLNTIPGIYNLPLDKIASMDGFGKKSIENLQAALITSKSQPLFKLINALGIRYVGETTAKTLAQQVEHLLDYANKTVEELQQLDDVGIKVATSIAEYFSNTDNLTQLQQLETIGINLKGNKGMVSQATGSLSGKTFLFTGTLTQLKRSQAEAMAEEKGGQILGGVSSKLNYLIVGADAGSKLDKAKKIASIIILTEEEFLKMMN
jgi:DNA ligase (NAD+)